MVQSAQGKDFSAYQADVTAADLKGLAFAAARVSNWSGTVMGTDPHFAANWAAFKAAGVQRMAYWFLLPQVSAVAQATYFVNAVRKCGLEPGDVMVCDSETLSPDVDVLTLAFQNQVKLLTGWPAAFIETYAPLSVARLLVATSMAFPSLWIAWPSPVAPVPSQWAPAKWKTWQHWQWGSPGGVDADAFNGTDAAMITWEAANIPPPVPVNAPAVTVTTDGKLSLAEIADLHHTQPSGILRATAVADQLYPAPVAAWLNGVFTGLTLPLTPLPAGLVLRIP